jgi:CDP-diacylglycerol--serine O-phosphatidyltransferase
MVPPLIVVVVLSIALLIAYPWVVLTAGTLAYLACLPFGYLSYRNYERRSAEAHADIAAAQTPGVVVNMIRMDNSGNRDDSDRPSRRN